MKYYIYISETKVNMFYDQIGLEIPKVEGEWQIFRENLTKYFIDSELKDLCFDLDVDYEILPGISKSDKARELIIYLRNRNRIDELVNQCRKLRPGVDWSIGAGGVQIETNASQYSKLNTLLAYLNEHNEIGRVENPKEFFKGELILRWGEFPDTGLVYFTGITNEVLLGLGGSLKHVTGNKPIKELESGGSRTAGIRRSLIEELELTPLIETLDQQDQRDRNALVDADDESMIWAIENACGRMVGARDRLEFVAYRLKVWESDQIPDYLGTVQRGQDLIFYNKVILGTPIYVAHVG